MRVATLLAIHSASTFVNICLFVSVCNCNITSSKYSQINYWKYLMENLGLGTETQMLLRRLWRWCLLAVCLPQYGDLTNIYELKAGYDFIETEWAYYISIHKNTALLGLWVLLILEIITEKFFCVLIMFWGVIFWKTFNFILVGLSHTWFLGCINSNGKLDRTKAISNVVTSNNVWIEEKTNSTDKYVPLTRT